MKSLLLMRVVRTREGCVQGRLVSLKRRQIGHKIFSLLRYREHYLCPKSYRDQCSGANHTGGNRSKVTVEPAKTPERAVTGDAGRVASPPCLSPWERLRSCALSDQG